MAARRNSNRESADSDAAEPGQRVLKDSCIHSFFLLKDGESSQDSTSELEDFDATNTHANARKFLSGR